MSFKANDKVVINNPKFAFDAMSGVVINTYNITPDNVAIVRLEDDQTVKVPFDSLLKLEPKTEIPADARAISSEQFEFAVIKVTAPDTIPDAENGMSTMVGLLTGLMVGMRIKDEIFAESNVIHVTKDQLAGMIYDGCNPKTLTNSVMDKMSVEACLHVSIAAILVLRKLINEFFPDAVKNA